MKLTSQNVKVVASVTTGTAGTVSYYMAPEEYDRMAIQGVLTAGTVTFTLWGTLDPNKSTSNYVDITQSIFGAASETGDFIWADWNGKLGCYSWIKIQAVAVGTVAAVYTIFSKRG